MTERPILFSGGMVKAILEGRKTQTRRVIKHILPTCQKIAPNGLENQNSWGMMGNNNGWTIACPYGVAGDCLWVRETWQPNGDAYLYRADPEFGEHSYTKGWRPSIHMPRKASRITLEIVNVRAERLQTITPEEVLAEGIEHTKPDGYWLAPLAGVNGYPWSHAWEAYASLWDSINFKRGYGWNVNPWVWVIEFKKM